MATANEHYIDAFLRHQIEVRKTGEAEAAAILLLLLLSDKSFMADFRAAASKLKGLPISSPAVRKEIRSLWAIREASSEVAKKKIVDVLKELIRIEAGFEMDLLRSSIPFPIKLNSPDLSKILDIPFSSGKNRMATFDQWFEGIKRVDQVKIAEVLQNGIHQGLTINQIARQVSGTRGASFKDGALSGLRSSSDVLMKTAITAVSNAAREAVWQANDKLVSILVWSSVLDRATTLICMSRDGKMTALSEDADIPEGRQLTPPSARPPAHPRCRSSMYVILDGEGIAEAAGRDKVVDFQGQQLSFREVARKRAGAQAWRTMTSAQRDRATAEARSIWANRVVGKPPSDLTYGEFLKRQDNAFQDAVLGKTRAQLFRTGKIQIDQYVDGMGRTLSLAQLAKLKPSAFKAAGLDPKDFIN